MKHSNKIIEPEGLFHILALSNLVIVDARDQAEFDGGHILDSASLPPSLLEEERKIPNGQTLCHLVVDQADARPIFQAAGINSDSRVVVYDEGGGYLAARLFWLLEYFGHENVQVLDGGMEGWREEVGIVTRDEPEPRNGDFHPVAQPEKLATFFDSLTAIQANRKQLLNSLSEEEFARGAIPGSLNLPYAYTYRRLKYPTLRSPAELGLLFERAGATQDKELICYCQVGYAAAQAYLAARIAGFEHAKVYDGSMEEWSCRGGELVPYGRVSS